MMNEGKIVCCGSSIFLKRKYGAGYFLNIAGEKDCDKSSVLQYVKGFVASAKLVSETTTDCSILLPMEEVEVFPKLLAGLEAESQKKALKIRSFGVSMTTLEDVFMKITNEDEGENEEEAAEDNGRSSKIDINKIKQEDLPLLSKDAQPSGFQLQLKSLLKKKLLTLRRNWKGSLISILVPSLLLLFTVGSLKASGSDHPTVTSGTDVLKPLNFDAYYPLQIPYSYDIINKTDNAARLFQALRYIQNNEQMLKFKEIDSVTDLMKYLYDDKSSGHTQHGYGA